MATSIKKPAHTLRNGNIRAAIWQQSGTQGHYFAASFTRSYRDQSGNWINSTSFGARDLESLLNAAFEAKEWMAAHGYLNEA